MSQKLYEENNIQDIANAIRSQNGTQNAYTVAQMGNAIRAIKTQPNLETLTANQNGTYTPSPDKDGFSTVNVDVDQESSDPVIEPLEINTNGTYTPPSGVDGYAPVTVNVSSGSGGNLYTNGQVHQSEEQITDVTGFTLLYDDALYFGNKGSKVAARLAITDESAHSTLQAGGWNAYGNSYYDNENMIGAYGGYNFGQEIYITKAKFWLGKYSGQNNSLIITAEYLDKNGNWNEIEDFKVSPNIPYPNNVFEIYIERAIYGIRWIHKKPPQKSQNNNIIFSGMSVYRGLEPIINVYTPDSTGLIMPPTGYDGFGPLYIN